MAVTWGELAPPRRALGLTFSNKAKANLKSRLRSELGPRWWKLATVTNFHGWAFHLYQHHCFSLGHSPLELAPQRGWQATTVGAICREYSCNRDDLQETLRSCKVGPFDEDMVLERLEASRSDAALAYERRIREEGRVDYDDLIRLGMLVLGQDRIVDLYRERFRVVVVDEVQDLSLGQYALAAPIAPGRTLWAGDSAQGIYGFAGAEPQAVMDQIRERGPREIELSDSYRSCPSVLRAVSALSVALGGQVVSPAPDMDWKGRGQLQTLRSRNVRQEAEWVASTVARWIEADEHLTVGVIARTARRRRWVDEAVRGIGLDAEVWDFPVHKPLIVDLLGRHLPAVDVALGPQDAVQDLHRRCLVEVDPSDLDSLDELNEAFDAIRELVREVDLRDIVSGIRVASAPDQPVGPGLHLLNGHVGKGQQFDRVIIVGLEESFLPHYFAMKSGRDEDLVAELSVLHVMASRARETLIAATCDRVPTWQGQDRLRDPSRWFALIEAEADAEIDLR